MNSVKNGGGFALLPRCANANAISDANADANANAICGCAATYGNVNSGLMRSRALDNNEEKLDSRRCSGISIDRSVPALLIN